MKTLTLTLLAFCGSLFAQQERIIVIPEKTEKPVPLFFSATADITATANDKETTSVQNISFRIHQGIPETLTLGLSGAGEITSVTGEDLRDWSVRIANDGSRFLDVQPNIIDPKNPPKRHHRNYRRLRPALVPFASASQRHVSLRLPL